MNEFLILSIGFAFGFMVGAILVGLLVQAIIKTSVQTTAQVFVREIADPLMSQMGANAANAEKVLIRAGSEIIEQTVQTFKDLTQYINADSIRGGVAYNFLDYMRLQNGDDEKPMTNETREWAAREIRNLRKSKIEPSVAAAQPAADIDTDTPAKASDRDALCDKYFSSIYNQDTPESEFENAELMGAVNYADVSFKIYRANYIGKSLDEFDGRVVGFTVRQIKVGLPSAVETVFVQGRDFLVSPIIEYLNFEQGERGKIQLTPKAFEVEPNFLMPVFSVAPEPATPPNADIKFSATVGELYSPHEFEVDAPAIGVIEFSDLPNTGDGIFIVKRAEYVQGLQMPLRRRVYLIFNTSGGIEYVIEPKTEIDESGIAFNFGLADLRKWLNFEFNAVGLLRVEREDIKKYDDLSVAPEFSHLSDASDKIY